MTDMQHKPEEFTPEQRRLLAQAYRLILSWKRDEPDPKSSSSDVSEDIETGERGKKSGGQVHDLPEKKRGRGSRA